MQHESDDDTPQLSLETFAALQEFYNEQMERESAAQEVSTSNICNMNISEDWQLSQFWYDEESIKTLTRLAIETVGKDGKIALISCPSLYKSIKNELSNNGEANLYEFDRRFAIFGTDFNFYDYKSPLEIPKHKSQYYDLVIADPPFLSDECLAKTSVTMKYLAKNKMILCTGAIMAPLADRLLSLKKTEFEPKHNNNLGNEFWCYSNYEVKL
ncbi:hypothetical protein WA026_016941 [Henosepilachna vigintioctopunctata]|uniref:Protein-lysine N-methyltransferase WA026_016941 n=1 Tax=Henosepilachna vigintioctopunctata TaxID=420089 RepID=A0AAW1U3Q0_9CUCU